MNDEEYKQYIKNKLKNSEEDFFADKDFNSKETWDRIEQKIKSKKIIPLWFYYAAASFAALLTLGIYSTYIIKGKNTEIAVLKNNIQKTQNQNDKIQAEKEIIIKKDTVFLQKQQTEYEKQVQYDTVTKYITNTITDTFFIEKNITATKEIFEADTDLTNEKLLLSKIIYEQEIKYKNRNKSDKRNRIKIKFLDNKNKGLKTEELYTDNSFIIKLNK